VKKASVGMFGSSVSPSVVVGTCVSQIVVVGPSVSLSKLKPVNKIATVNDDGMVVTRQAKMDGGALGVTDVPMGRGVNGRLSAEQSGDGI
jgi:hypothetical protein